MIDFPARLWGLVMSIWIFFYLLVDAVHRYQAVVILVGIFDRLDTQKDGAEEHRQHDHYHLHRAVALLGVVDRQCHRQRTDDQDERVEAAPEGIKMVTTSRKRHREPGTIDEVSGEQSAEKHDLLHQEHPHPDGYGFFLLLHVIELMLQPRLVINEFL